MNKALTLALLLGVATANSITGWTYPEMANMNERFMIIDHEQAMIKGYFEFDFGWSTHYMGMAPEMMPMDPMMMDMQSESYGVNLYSYALLNLDSEFLMYYMNNLQFYFEPFMVAPYTQTIAWKRPESGEFHMYLMGSREIRALDYMTMVTENTKIGKSSLYQTLMMDGDMMFDMSDMMYEMDFENKYMDPYWMGNVLEMVAMDTYTDLMDMGVLGM